MGWGSVDEKDINKTISFIESNKMAHDAMTKPAVNASVFSYTSMNKKTITKSSGKIICSMCGESSDKFVWSRRKNKSIECSSFMQCWKRFRK